MGLGVRANYARYFVLLYHLIFVLKHCKLLVQGISPYSVRMRENVDQNNSKYGRFLRSEYLHIGLM